MRRGFTLIELLVVIAIIAILAAILFPVFAQAKLEAKKAASISNVKQVNIGAQIYCGDHDDTVPTAQTWEGYSGKYFSWTSDIQPYIKNWDIYFSPLGGNRLISSWNTSPADDWYDNWRWFVQYGFNASYLNLAPNCDVLNANANAIEGNAFGDPVSLTAAADPSATVEFAESGQDAPDDNVGTMIVYPPGGQLASDVCTWGDWGANPGLYYGVSPYGSTMDSGMGFFRPREHGGIVGFLDGHAKVIHAGELAAGTDWSIDQPYGTALITDRSRYLWDLQ